MSRGGTWAELCLWLDSLQPDRRLPPPLLLQPPSHALPPPALLRPSPSGDATRYFIQAKYYAKGANRPLVDAILDSRQ